MTEDLRDAHTGLRGWQAERISRTETMRLWNMGHFGRMETEDEGLVGYEYSVVLDPRTSDICRPIAGLMVKRGDILHLPPLHPHCRTIVEPVYDFDEVPEKEYGDPSAPEAIPGFGAVPRAEGVIAAIRLPRPPAPIPTPIAPPPVAQPPVPVQPAVPAFRNLTEAKAWMVTNVADRVEVPPNSKASGLRLMSEAILEINDRFGLGKLDYIGDPNKWGSPVGWDGRALAGFFAHHDGMIFDARATDARKVAAYSHTGTWRAQQRMTLAGLYDTITRGIQAGAYDADLQAIASRLTSIRFSPVETVKQVVYHEFGHRLELVHPDKRALDRLAMTAYNRGWSIVLSDYARTDHSELLAESFCVYMSGETERLNPDLLAWFRLHDKDAP